MIEREENSCGKKNDLPGIVFDAQIDVFLKTEAKGSHVGKAILAQLVLNDLTMERGEKEETGVKEITCWFYADFMTK